MDKLIDEFDPTHYHKTIFRYDPDGWKLSDRFSCANCNFFDVHTSKYFNPNSNIEYLSDYPVGERAVAHSLLVGADVPNTRIIFTEDNVLS